MGWEKGCRGLECQAEKAGLWSLTGSYGRHLGKEMTGGNGLGEAEQEVWQQTGGQGAAVCGQRMEPGAWTQWARTGRGKQGRCQQTLSQAFTRVTSHVTLDAGREAPQCDCSEIWLGQGESLTTLAGAEVQPAWRCQCTLFRRTTCPPGAQEAKGGVQGHLFSYEHFVPVQRAHKNNGHSHWPWLTLSCPAQVLSK